MSDVTSFLSALANHWISLMSGVVSLILTLIFRARKEDVANKTFLGIAALCFLFAFYLTWQDERVKNRLTCQIDKVVAGEWPDSKVTQVFVLVSVRNAGAQTIAENYKLHIQASDIECKATPTPLPKGYPIKPSDKAPTTTFDQAGSLIEKTNKHIESGDMVQGWLRFALGTPEATPSPDLIRRPGVKYTVTLSDVSGNVCTAEHVMTEGDGKR